MTQSDPSTNAGRTLKVLIVRHGQTDFNIKRIFQGHVNTALNESGRSQAVILGKYLKSHTDTKLDAVYGSDLQRVITTTNLIISQMGYIDSQSFDPTTNLLKNPDSRDQAYNIPATFTFNLRERDLGELEFMPVKDALAKAQREGKSLSDYGESVKSVNQRIRQVWGMIIDQARQNPEWKTVLIVSHGGAISRLCSDLVNMGAIRIADEVPEESIKVPPNTSVTTLEVPLDKDTEMAKNPRKIHDHKVGKLVEFGSTVHLSAPVETFQDEK